MLCSLLGKFLLKHPKKFGQIDYFYQKLREINRKNDKFSLTKIFSSNQFAPY